MIVTRTIPTLVIALAFQASALAQQGTTTRVVFAFDGGIPNDHCYISGSTPEGRFVAITTAASNLVPGHQGYYLDAFVRDRLLNSYRVASSSSSGGAANGSTSAAAISDNSRYVSMTSDATNLIVGDTNLRTDVFRKDMVTGHVDRVSISTIGSDPNGSSYGGSMSSDGRYIAFSSEATNIYPGDTTNNPDIFVRDMVLETTVRASSGLSGQTVGGQHEYPNISKNGRFVVFDSNSTQLITGDVNGMYDVFMRDLQNGVISAVSRSAGGMLGNGDSLYPTLSADGRYVAFTSYASNLISGDTNGVGDIYVKDTVTGAIRRVSVSSSGLQSNGLSTYPSISDDGRFVAFRSNATNLWPSDTNGRTDVFVHDLMTDQTTLVSKSSAGVIGNYHSESGVMSGDGKYVFFRSISSNLVPGNPIGQWDGLVHQIREDGILSGAVTLSEYSGVLANLPIAIAIYLEGQVTPLMTLSSALNSSGAYSIPLEVFGGRFDVALKCTHWLASRRNGVEFSPSVTINVLLINGDVDGDNEVGPGDFGELSASFGSEVGSSNWNANADLDGDSEVGPSDFGILSSNFGLAGE